MSLHDPRHRIVVAAALLGGWSSVACGGGGAPQGVEISSPAPVKPARWELQWSDEFDGTMLNEANWIAVEGAAEVNGELQYYSPEDVYLENGLLVLRTRQRPMGGRGYTSGEVRTGRKRMVTRGFAVEWRTRAPRGKGIWPANWLVHNACTGLVGCGSNWPPEIDVVELKGSQPMTNIMTHWWGSWPNQQSQTTTWTGPDLSADFHVYRVEWFADSIHWYIDGERRARHTQNITSGQLQLVMNTAVGGHFDGPPDSTTVFPVYHHIDYVRVYRDNGNSPD